MSTSIGYQKPSNLHDNDFITDPTIPDPDNLPQPLGWNILVRPYPVEQLTKGGIILSVNDAEYTRNATNIARVVSIGPCAWNRAQHKNKDGERFEWYEVGDFISYPRFKGAMRNYKGVTFCLLSDDDPIERLIDPVVFSDGESYKLNIPEEDLIRYNTIYNPKFNNKI